MAKQRKRKHPPSIDRWGEWHVAEITPESAQRLVDAGFADALPADDEMILKNNRFQVIVHPVKNDDDKVVLVHLSIRRLDRKPLRDWREFQRIKNEICGPEHEAVELFPAESRLVDQANQYHLWVLPPGVRFPFGFDAGRQVDYSTAESIGAVQRSAS